MSDQPMNLAGRMPTPYGVMIDVMSHGDAEDENNLLFSAQSAALLAGIHDEEQRDAFARRVKDAGYVDPKWLADFGGKPVPRVHLTKPEEPVYPTLPRDQQEDIPTEAFVTMLMDRHRWCDRVDPLLHAVEANLTQSRSWQASLVKAPKVMGIVMAKLTTGALEHLHEEAIECIEAAAVYSLSDHEQWRQAGIAWLEPVRETWFRDWRDARPAYRLWAAARIEEGMELPAWLAGGDE